MVVLAAKEHTPEEAAEAVVAVVVADRRGEKAEQAV